MGSLIKSFLKYISQFSRSVRSNFLRPHESQHARPPCPSLTPGVYSNPCPSSRWCHPAISSSVVPFSSCLRSLPASGYFPMSQLFAWSGQSIGVSASASVLPMNTQDLSPSGWTGWISLQSKGLSRVFSNTTVQTPCVLLLKSLHCFWCKRNISERGGGNKLDFWGKKKCRYVCMASACKFSVGVMWTLERDVATTNTARGVWFTKESTYKKFRGCISKKILLWRNSCWIPLTWKITWWNSREEANFLHNCFFPP